jgi:hypothetical protein
MDSGKVEIEISIRLRGNQNDVNQGVVFGKKGFFKPVSLSGKKLALQRPSQKTRRYVDNKRFLIHRLHRYVTWDNSGGPAGINTVFTDMFVAIPPIA